MRALPIFRLPSPPSPPRPEASFLFPRPSDALDNPSTPPPNAPAYLHSAPHTTRHAQAAAAPGPRSPNRAPVWPQGEGTTPQRGGQGKNVSLASFVAHRGVRCLPCLTFNTTHADTPKPDPPTHPHHIHRGNKHHAARLVCRHGPAARGYVPLPPTHPPTHPPHPFSPDALAADLLAAVPCLTYPPTHPPTPHPQASWRFQPNSPTTCVAWPLNRWGRRRRGGSSPSSFPSRTGTKSSVVRLPPTHPPTHPPQPNPQAKPSTHPCAKGIHPSQSQLLIHPPTHPPSGHGLPRRSQGHLGRSEEAEYRCI